MVCTVCYDRYNLSQVMKFWFLLHMQAVRAETGSLVRTFSVRTLIGRALKKTQVKIV